MAFLIRSAQHGDLDALLPLMQRLYEEDGIASFRLDPHRRATEELLQTPDAGRMYVVEEQSELIGYAVLTWGHSLEFGGRYALLDEIYVAPEHRGRGVGRGMMARLEAVCHEHAVGAIRLETERSNTHAQRFYRNQGFREESRHLFTKWLDE